jgi:hypothetical protein
MNDLRNLKIKILKIISKSKAFYTYSFFKELNIFLICAVFLES